MLTQYQPTKMSERLSYNPPWPTFYINHEGVVVHATQQALSLFDLTEQAVCNHHYAETITSSSHDLGALFAQTESNNETFRDILTMQIGQHTKQCHVLIRFFARVNLFLFVLVEVTHTNKKDEFNRIVELFLGRIVGDTGLRKMIAQLQEHFSTINLGIMISLLQTPVDIQARYPMVTREFAGLWVFGKQLPLIDLPYTEVLSFIVNKTSTFQTFDDLREIVNKSGENSEFEDLFHRFSITGMYKFIGVPLVSNGKQFGFALIGGPFFDEYDIHQIFTSVHYLQGSISQFHAQSYLSNQIVRLERLNEQINQLVNIQTEQHLYAEVCRACMAIFDARYVFMGLVTEDTISLARSTIPDELWRFPFDAQDRQQFEKNYYTTTLSAEESPMLQYIATSTQNDVMACVPMFENQRLIGVIGVCHQFREILTDRDLVYARQFADFIGSHYTRIRLTTALNDSEQRYRFLLNETSLALLVTDAQFMVTHMNHAARRMFGIDDDQAIHLLSFLDEHDNQPTHTWPAQSMQLRTLIVDKVQYQTHVRNRLRNTKTPIELEAQLLRQDNQVEYMITLRDIQERITIEQEFQLREREIDLFQHITSVVNSSLNLDELLQRSLDILDEAEFGSMTAIILIDEDGKPQIAAYRRVPHTIIEVSKSNPYLLWSAFDQILPDNEKLVIPTNLPLDAALTNQMMVQIGHIIGGKLTADERIIGLSLAAHPYKSHANFSPRDLQILNAVSNQLSRAVTNAKLHTSLQQAADRYINLYQEAETIRANLALIINSSPDVLMLVNRHSWNMRILNAQPLAALHYNVDELTNKSFAVLCAPENHDVLIKQYSAITENSTYSFEQELVRGDGQSFVALIATNAMNNDDILFVIKDITLMRQLENRIKQREKLALIGQMIASVAHELNNPIAVIRGIAQLQLLNQHDPQTQHDFAVIEQTSQRAGKIVQQLRSLLQPQQLPMSMINLYQCVMRILDSYIQNNQLQHITLVFDTQLDDFLVLGIESQLEQVFVNLIDNAIRAMTQPDTSHKLTISLDKNPQHVTVHIDDTGPGIAPHIRKTIFEPFVTSRATGEGMGLGLAIVHAIITQHQGKIENFNIPPHGTRFTITLPSADAPRMRVANATHDNSLYTTITEILRELTDSPIVEVESLTSECDLLIIDENALPTIAHRRHQINAMCFISHSGQVYTSQTSVIISPTSTNEQIRQQLSSLLPYIVV
ncbi:MAG: PAS domain S-box protein [Chloroflexi bacterium]|nr:PAS domain S-box protein [Chloroflexota bacterium]